MECFSTDIMPPIYIVRTLGATAPCSKHRDICCCFHRSNYAQIVHIFLHVRNLIEFSWLIAWHEIDGAFARLSSTFRIGDTHPIHKYQA